MRSIPSWLVVIVAVVLVVLGGISLSAQDKYTVQVPNGLALSECRGYEDWPAVAVSYPESTMGSPQEPDDKLNLIVANSVMIDAYRAGIPGNGKPFPDGSKIMKILWMPKQHAEAPFAVKVPGTLSGIGCMVKDSGRFPDTGGWGLAQFDYDPASDTFTPNTSLQGNDAKCGHACHTIVEAKDYVFTAYGKR
jgi:Cytochrome P460